MSDLNEVWNVDDERRDHESEEHWKLRRTFMERIQYQYPKVRVVSLSQVFANMEILGCRYPAATMELVKELGQGISEEYRASQENFAQRTFMNASTAAEKKAKDGFPSSPATNNSHVLSRSQKSVSSTASHFVPATERPVKPHKFSSSNTSSIDASKPEQVQLLTSQFSNLLLSQSQKKIVPVPKPNFSNGPAINTPTLQSKVKGKPGPSDHASTADRGVDEFTEGELKECHELVLVEELYKPKCTAAQILPLSCKKCKLKFLVEYFPEDETGSKLSRCKWVLGKHCIAEGVGPTREGAKHDAYVKALQRLRQVCYTVQIKEKIVGLKTVTKNDLIVSIDDPLYERSNSLAGPQSDSQTGLPKHSTTPSALSDDNVGNKLLRLMGWNGGALGKNEDGITEAIQASGSAGRERLGLGLVEKKNKPTPLAPGEYTQKALKKFLIDELKGASRTLDIIFATEFSAREREAIHIAAQNIGLKSRSYGAKPKRQLVVSKDVTLHDLVDELLCIGETGKYRLIKPISQAI